MSRSTFSILPYINRQKVKADGTANILCRITVDGKSAAISTGGENGAFPPTRNGCIHSLSMRERG